MITVNTAAAEVLMLHSAEFQMFEDSERDGQRHIIGELQGIPVALTFGAVDPRTGRTPAVRSRYKPSAKSQTTNHLNSN